MCQIGEKSEARPYSECASIFHRYLPEGVAVLVGAGASAGNLSDCSTQLAVCNTQPMQHCSLVVHLAEVLH